jgi:hypothetical protein
MSSCAASARTSPHVVHLCGPQKLPDEIAAATSRGSLAPDGHLYRRRRDRLRPTRVAYRGQSGCLPDQGRRNLLFATSAHASHRSGPVRPVLGSANSRSGSCKQISSHGGVDTSTAAYGVMQPSAIGAGDDCCHRGRSRSSRALWRRAARQAAPGAHDGSPTGCDSRAHGVARDRRRPRIFRPRYDGRLLTDDCGIAASRLPDGRNGRSVAGDLSRSRSLAVKRQPAFVCQRH